MLRTLTQSSRPVATLSHRAWVLCGFCGSAFGMLNKESPPVGGLSFSLAAAWMDTLTSDPCIGGADLWARAARWPQKTRAGTQARPANDSQARSAHNAERAFSRALLPLSPRTIGNQQRNTSASRTGHLAGDPAPIARCGGEPVTRCTQTEKSGQRHPAPRLGIRSASV